MHARAGRLHRTGVRFHHREIWEYCLFRNKSLFRLVRRRCLGEEHEQEGDATQRAVSLTGAGRYSTLNVLKVASGQEGGGEVRSGISGDLQGRLRFPGGDTSRSLISAVGISDRDRLRCHADIDLPEGKEKNFQW